MSRFLTWLLGPPAEKRGGQAARPSTVRVTAGGFRDLVNAHFPYEFLVPADGEPS